MSYSPTTWESGDVISSAKLNKMEQGIANAGGGGGVLIVHDVEGTLDHTWQEIIDAGFAVLYAYSPKNGKTYVDMLSKFGHIEGEDYYVSFGLAEDMTDYAASSADGYPVLQDG